MGGNTMWYREHGGKVMSIGEYVDHLTSGARVDPFGGGPGESMTLGRSIDTEIHGYQEECHRLLEATEAARCLAGAVIASGGGGLPLAAAQKLLEMTKGDV
jgi:hypothetical protein